MNYKCYREVQILDYGHIGDIGGYGRLMRERKYDRWNWILKEEDIKKDSQKKPVEIQMKPMPIGKESDDVNWAINMECGTVGTESTQIISRKGKAECAVFYWLLQPFQFSKYIFPLFSFLLCTHDNSALQLHHPG